MNNNMRKRFFCGLDKHFRIGQSVLLLFLCFMNNSESCAQSVNVKADSILFEELMDTCGCEQLTSMRPKDYGARPKYEMFNARGDVSSRMLDKWKKKDWLKLFDRRHRMPFSKYNNPAWYYVCDSCDILSVKLDKEKGSPYRGLVVEVVFACRVIECYVSPYNGFLYNYFDSIDVRNDVEKNRMKLYRNIKNAAGSIRDIQDTFSVAILKSDWQTQGGKMLAENNHHLVVVLDHRLSTSCPLPIMAVRLFEESEVDISQLYSYQQLVDYLLCKYKDYYRRLYDVMR